MLQLLTRLALVVTVAGCCPDADTFVSDAPGCDDTFCGEPSALVGTSPTGYEAIDEGAAVDLVFGPQGGYHIDVSAQMDGLCPIVSIKVTLLTDDGTELAFEEHRVQAVRADKGTIQEYWGLTALVPCGYWPLDGPYDGPNPPGCPDGYGLEGQVTGNEVTLVVEVEDDNGRIGRGERTVIPGCCAE